MRKIKLMALLLAALMVVTAFAGCAGVKKEELDAIDGRVEALENLLNGQQASLDEIKDSVNAGKDNSDVLEAIESIKKDLEDKIKDVNDRVESEVGKTDGATNTVSDETKAAQQKALALIEVRRAEFVKTVDSYAAEDYTKISEALGTATGAVNAATTTAAVDAAMAALNAELGKYMTYAMKAYDYYTQLLGGVNADAEALVDEAKAFLKDVKKVYDGEKVTFVGKLNNAASGAEVEEYEAELAYLVSEGTTEARDVYINVYKAVEDLCTLYSAKSASESIPYVKNGKVEFADLVSLNEYTKEAKALVERIEDTIGENLIYNSASYNAFDELATDYEEFVEDAAMLGGEKLTALVTNAAEFVAAEDSYKLIKEAAEKFTTATRVTAGKYENVFYYYEQLGSDKANLETADEDWVADEYEKVEDILAAWIADYELSEDNVKEIIKDKKNSTFYDTYILNKHKNDLLVKAVDTFETEIASKILALNETKSGTVDTVLAYDEIVDLFEDFVVLQKKTNDKTVKAPYNTEIKLDKVNFKVIVREADIFDDYAEERLDDAFKSDVKMDDFLETNGLIGLFTFEADIDEIEDKEDDTKTTDNKENVYFDEKYDNRAEGTIYKFLTKTYGDIKGYADKINVEIEALVEAVEEKTIDTNKKFAELTGEYKKLENAETYKSGEFDLNKDGLLVPDVDDKDGDDDKEELVRDGKAYYVDIDEIKWNVTGKTNAEALEAHFETVVKSTAPTIRAFSEVYPEFVEILDLDEFNAAYKTMNDRMVELFDLAEAIVEDVEAVGYVRHSSKTVYYEDLNGNDKYDDTDKKLTVAPSYLVSLNDKADVDAAYKTYIAWSDMGGTLAQTMFDNYVADDDTKYDDVYVLQAIEGNDVKESVALVHDLVEDIEYLKWYADKFINTVKAVKSVDAANKFVVNKSTNHLIADTSSNDAIRNRLAWTSYTESKLENAKTYDGTYKLISANGYDTNTFNTTDNGVSTSDDAVAELKNKAITKAELIGLAVTYYNDFHDVHVEYIPDANNDYENGDEVYYQVEDYAAYAAFDAAAADYEAYNVLSVKSYLLNLLSDSNTYQAQLRNEINIATSLTKMINNVKTYLTVNGFNLAMSATELEVALDAVSIVDIEIDNKD